MGFSKVAEIATRIIAGNSHIQHVFKAVVIGASSTGGWVDSSMSSGTPVYNAYVGAPLDSTALYGQKNQGIFTGGPGDKRLVCALFQTRTGCVPAVIELLDYLMFYPFFDLDSTDPQDTLLVNTLPRYATGVGVRIMPVMTLASTAPTTCTVTYTNSDGIGNRITTFLLNTATAVGQIPAIDTLIGETPFIPLIGGDQGVRSIEFVQFSTAVGGFVCMVLVKPLATVTVPELNTCSEVCFVANKMAVPQILSGAYLNFIVKTQVATSSSWLGQLTFVGD